MHNTHRYLLLLYFRVSIFTVLCFGMLTFMLPNIISSANNNTWNRNAVGVCANVTKTHTVQFYYTYSDPGYSQSEPYYDGYVIVAYLNCSYEFRKYSWYSNHTQLKSDLKECCTIGMCVDIYYDKNDPANASQSLMNVYTFPLWITALVVGLLTVLGTLAMSYRYDKRYHTDLLMMSEIKEPYSSGLLSGP